MIKEMRPLSTGSEQTKSNTNIVRNDTNNFRFWDVPVNLWQPGLFVGA
jgi:hypothetical protein